MMALYLAGCPLLHCLRGSHSISGPSNSAQPPNLATKLHFCPATNTNFSTPKEASTSCPAANRSKFVPTWAPSPCSENRRSTPNNVGHYLQMSLPSEPVYCNRTELHLTLDDYSGQPLDLVAFGTGLASAMEWPYTPQDIMGPSSPKDPSGIVPMPTSDLLDKVQSWMAQQRVLASPSNGHHGTMTSAISAHGPGAHSSCKAESPALRTGTCAGVLDVVLLASHKSDGCFCVFVLYYFCCPNVCSDELPRNTPPARSSSAFARLQHFHPLSVIFCSQLLSNPRAPRPRVPAWGLDVSGLRRLGAQRSATCVYRTFAAASVSPTAGLSSATTATTPAAAATAVHTTAVARRRPSSFVSHVYINVCVVFCGIVRGAHSLAQQR